MSMHAGDNAETNALAEYSRVLRIFADLMIHGKLPASDE